MRTGSVEPFLRCSRVKKGFTLSSHAILNIIELLFICLHCVMDLFHFIYILFACACFD